jgi:hypothetical protein
VNPGKANVTDTFGKRSWIKLWTVEWLEGTTRYQMSDGQRAFFVDLIAMAGRSRTPGVICAGSDSGQIVGYPLKRFEVLVGPTVDVLETFALFERLGKTKIAVTNSTEPKLYSVELVNWKKYQSNQASQNLRQQRHRAKGKEVATGVTGDVTTESRPVTSVEVDRDEDPDIEPDKEDKTGAAEAAAPFKSTDTAASTDSSDRVKRAFSEFECAPFGSIEFQLCWTKECESISSSGAAPFFQAMENTIQTCKKQGIRVPNMFYTLKRKIEGLHMDGLYKRTPL